MVRSRGGVERPAEKVAGERLGRCRGVPALVALVAVALPPPPAWAAPWIIRQGLTIRETYSDNVNLAPPGQEESGFVTDITPLFSIRSAEQARGRITGTFDYQLQTFTIGGGDAPNSLNHQFQADGTAEVIEEFAFVDFRSTVGQQVVDVTGQVADDNIADTGNRADVFTLAFSPYIRNHFGTFADTELRYQFDNVINEGRNLGDSSSQRISLGVSSGRRFARAPWSLTASHQEVDNDQSADTTFQRIDGTISYQINRRYNVFGGLGYDNNDFVSTQDTDGARWRLGITWTPTPRTSVQAGYGDSFTGANFFLDATHRSRRTVWSASFQEDITTTRQLQLDRQLFTVVDAFGQPVFDNTGSAVQIPLDIASINDDTLVRQRFELSMAAQGRRTSFNVTVFDESREFQRSGDDETVRGLRATASRSLSRRTTARIGGSWQESQFNQLDRDDTLYQAEASLTHRFGQNLNGTLSYRRFARESTDPNAEFDENRISARVSMTF